MNIEQVCKSILEKTIKTGENMDWGNKLIYAMWSAQTYYFVKHSTRLFALAAARCPLEENNFHFRYLKHLNDEKGHENLSVNDIKILNYKMSDLPELPATKSLYQTQYYWIEHQHPYSFFGYLLALEGLAVYIGPKVYQQVKNAYGEQATKFLKIHTEEDQDHLKEVYTWLQKMDETNMKLTIQNLEQCADNYNNLLNAITTYAETFKVNSSSRDFYL